MQILTSFLHSTTRTCVRVRGLSYAYKGLRIFDNLSLEAEGNLVILRGPSGCGKTTLLKLLSGNLPPDAATAMPPSQNSCLVLQEDSLFPWLTGTENIALLTKIRPFEFQKHPMYYLISAFAEQKACRMSYGQRRLVELFRAIIFKPDYLYLDEPFNFLDGNRIHQVLRFLQAERLEGRQLILSNHHREDLACLGKADIFQFDGSFPITSLTNLNH